MGLQLLLIIIRAILAASIRVEKAARRRIAKAHSHVERPDRKISLHPVASGPANDPATVEVTNDRKIEPALVRPDVGDIACPLLVRCRCNKITIQCRAL